jgi:hypothetical protein
MSKNIIIANLGGGIGNMMFMTAAAYSLSRDLNYTIMFDDNHYGIRHNHPLFYRDTIFRHIPNVNVDTSDFVNVGQPGGFHYTPIDSIPDSNIRLCGYFQSEKYFEKYSKEIINLFGPTEEIKNNLLEKYGDILKLNTVSIHIRRGDYVHLSTHHYNLSMAYYKNAIEYFKGYTFLIFSDDTKWCKNNFVGENFIFIENETDLEDLYLMSFCKNNVIANSTFSWWGAYLNTNENKKVIYPNKWFGPAYAEWKTHDIFPENWIRLNDD